MAEDVYRRLRHDLITLAHRPGAAVTEQELARLYGSSRVPVREACRRLQQEGLLTAVPYKGYFVNHISLKEIRDCFELRLVLEEHAVSLAAERASADDLRRLAELAATEYTSDDWTSYADFLERNLDFHIQLAAVSGNEQLVGALHDLLWSMQRFFFLGLDLGDFGGEMRREHEELVEALRRRDATAAAASLRTQISESRDRIVRALVEGRIDIPLE